MKKKKAVLVKYSVKWLRKTQMKLISVSKFDYSGI